MRLPAEWEPQQTVLFTFPRRAGDWGDGLTTASEAMIAAANAVNDLTPVTLVVSDEEHFGDYEDGYQGKVFHAPTDDCWIRDYGPISTILDERALVLNHFVFDGWGGKFEAEKDDGVTQRLWRAEYPEAGYRRAEIILEGGSLESDGAGTLLTTGKCLLSDGRNDWPDEAAAEAALAEYFDFDRLLWLHHGELAGDDTDAHVDTLARFLDAETIAYVRCDDPEDEHYAELQRMEEELKVFRKQDGRPYTLFPLPWPPAILAADGHRLPATYANFLISNGTVFVPTYFNGAPKKNPERLVDEAALQAFRDHGAYKVVGVDCRAFIEQHGSLHCLTMQVPAFTAG